KLVDVRSPQEFSGELLHMPDYPQEGSLRGGHIPGAKSVPWKRAANDDGTFKSVEELKAIYEGEQGLSSDNDVVAYCRIGERSSHTWFVLSHLLGYPKVRNYDGSWAEWGNLVRAPIERGRAQSGTSLWMPRPDRGRSRSGLGSSGRERPAPLVVARTEFDDGVRAEALRRDGDREPWGGRRSLIADPDVGGRVGCVAPAGHQDHGRRGRLDHVLVVAAHVSARDRPAFQAAHQAV